jgi:hypothetical protein
MKAQMKAPQQGQKDTLLLLDFDGTIMFDENALATAAKAVTGREMLRGEIRKLDDETKKPIYHLAMTEYRHLMRPNPPVIELAKGSFGRKRVMVLTARLEDVSKETADLLRVCEMPYDELMLRPPELVFMDDEHWKADVIAGLLPKYRRIEVYEDKLDNLEHFADRFGIGTVGKGVNCLIDYFHVKRDGIVPLENRSGIGLVPKKARSDHEWFWQTIE